MGCGRWGRHVVRDLAALGCDVTVAARSAASAARARSAGATATVPALAGLPEVEGIVVTTPTRTHADITAEALARGVPVYVEKPLADDAAVAAQLAAAAPDRLFVMDKWRYHPGVRELARIAAAQELGPVAALHLRRISCGHGYADVDPVWILLPHDLSIALEILGEVPAARWAAEERVGRQRVGLTAGLGDAVPVSAEVSAAGDGHHREVRLVCEDGWAVLPGGYAEALAVLRGPLAEPAAEHRPIAGELPLLAELRAFVEHLRGGPPPRSSAAEGAAIVQRIEELGALARTPAEAEAM